MRISDWSSDVCSSDLGRQHGHLPPVLPGRYLRFLLDEHRREERPCLHDRDRGLPERQRSGDAASAHGCGEGPRSRLLPFLCAICVDQAMVADGHADAFGQGTTPVAGGSRSEEHTSELQSLMRISYAVFCLKTKKMTTQKT